MTSPSDVAAAPSTADTADDGTHTEPDTGHVVEEMLGRLIERGYRFVHPKDASGEVVTIVGVRPHGTVIDVVRLDAEHEVSATRMPMDEENILAPGTVLWQCEGELREVIDALLALPDVSAESQVPRQAGLARGCWVPSGRDRSRWLTAGV